MIASFNLKSFGVAFLRISKSICQPTALNLIIARHTANLLTLLYLRHLTRASTTCSYGSFTAFPIQQQADILTFQKLSLSSSTNLFTIFLLGFSHIFDIAQHAILLHRLSLSHRHLLISSIESKASGRPIIPNEFNAACLISGFGFIRHLFRALIISTDTRLVSLLCSLPITSCNLKSFELLSGPFLIRSSFQKFQSLELSIRFRAARKSRALIQRLSQQSSSSKQKAEGSMLP